MNEFFDIDPNKLPEEWVEQPRLYREHADKLAEAHREVEVAKAALEMTVAELDKAIRLNPSEYGIEKVTESAVSNTIVLQKQYKKSKRRLIDAKYDEDVFQNAVTTLEHKKYALQNLVQLRLSDIYAEPTTPKGKAGETIRKYEEDNAFKRKTDEQDD